MERLEEIKKGEEERLAGVTDASQRKDVPTELPEFELFLTVLRTFSEEKAIQNYRAKIIEKLIHRVEVIPDGFKLYFHVGNSHITGELATAGSPPFLCPKYEFGAARTQDRLGSSTPNRLNGPLNNFEYFGSKSLKNGWGARIRTWECWNQNPVTYHLSTPQTVWTLNL